MLLFYLQKQLNLRIIILHLSIRYASLNDDNFTKRRSSGWKLFDVTRNVNESGKIYLYKELSHFSVNIIEFTF